MRAFVSVDMEGMPFIVSPEHLSVRRKLFEEARKIATKVVVTVVERLHVNGFEEMIVADSHGGMINIDVLEMPEYVEVLRGYPRPVSMVLGVEECDAVLFLGYHAKFGTSHSTFDHTYSGATYRSVKINGVEVSEYLLNTYIAGHFNKPVILVAGEEKLMEEVEKYTPWAVRVPLKKSFSRYSARSLSLKRLSKLLQEAVDKAVNSFKNGLAKPLKTKSPVDLELVFHSSLYADAASLMPGVVRTNGLTVKYKARDVVEAYKVMELLSLAANGVRNIFST